MAGELSAFAAGQRSLICGRLFARRHARKGESRREDDKSSDDEADDDDGFDWHEGPPLI